MLCHVQFYSVFCFTRAAGAPRPLRALRARCAGSPRSRVRNLASLGAGPSGPLRALRARRALCLAASRCPATRLVLATCFKQLARLPFYLAPTWLFRVASKGQKKLILMNE